MNINILNHPIQWIDGENSCRWNGNLMDDDECLKLFGTTYYEIEEGEGYCLVGDRLYGDLKKLKANDGDTDVARDIEEVFPYEDLCEINLPLIRQFTEDLDSYYEMRSNGETEYTLKQLYDIF